MDWEGVRRKKKLGAIAGEKWHGYG